MYGDENEREVTPQVDWAMLDKCKFLGKKMKTIFIISLLMLITSTVITVTTWLAAQRLIWLTKGTLYFLILCAGAIIIFAIAYCVVLISMGAYYEAFTYSGILMIIASFLSVWEEFNESAELALLISLASSVAEIFQMKFFVSGCESSLYGVDNSLSASWSTYWKIYVTILVTGIVAAFCLFIPGINILAALAILVVALVSIGISIWMLILIKQTADALSRRAVTLEYKGGVAS